ncbi:MAG TPA: hypothetical protein VLU96_05995 [Gaiellaceae bacterium]|nr:hypothetical protein [Gaiellaceae bacterium]
MTTDLLAQRFEALADQENDSDWVAVRRRRRRPAVLALAVGVVVVATLGVGAAFALYGDVLPFGSQPPAPKSEVRDFQEFSKFAPPGMDPQVLAGETRRIATFPDGRRRVVLYVAPTKKGGFCEVFAKRFGGCRQTRTLPAGAPTGRPGEVNSYAIGMTVESGEQGATHLGGDILLPPGTSLHVEFADGASAEIPVIFVSPPIDAGFFYYRVPEEHLGKGHEATYMTARDREGHVVARVRVPSPSRLPGSASVSW